MNEDTGTDANLIKRNRMGRACVTNGRQDKYIVFWWGDVRGRDHLEDLGVEGRTILKWILKK
jgi:hypothetical protein